MNCPKCNSQLKPGVVFCDTCGSKLIFNMTGEGVSVRIEENNSHEFASQKNNDNLNISQQINASMNQVSSNNDVDELSLIDAYIGKNSDKLKSGFSFCTLLFGVMYVFYRKMWGLGFLWLLINIAISIFLPKLPFLGLILNIIISCCFKNLYINHATNKVRQIKLQYSNFSNSELVYVCSKKGGTTIVPIIIIIVTYVSITLIATKIVLDIINDAKESAGISDVKNETSVQDRTAEFIIKHVERSHAMALVKKQGSSITFEDVKNEFDMFGATWNNNTITDNNSKTTCNVFVNASDQLYVECDVNGEKITSELMELSQ